MGSLKSCANCSRSRPAAQPVGHFTCGDSAGWAPTYPSTYCCTSRWQPDAATRLAQDELLRAKADADWVRANRPDGAAEFEQWPTEVDAGDGQPEAVAGIDAADALMAVFGLTREVPDTGRARDTERLEAATWRGIPFPVRASSVDSELVIGVHEPGGDVRVYTCRREMERDYGWHSSEPCECRRCVPVEPNTDRARTHWTAHIPQPALHCPWCGASGHGRGFCSRECVEEYRADVESEAAE